METFLVGMVMLPVGKVTYQVDKVKVQEYLI
jgi:hypothetical protein